MATETTTTTIREQKIGAYTAYLQSYALESGTRYAVIVPKFGRSIERTAGFNAKFYYSAKALSDAAQRFAQVCNHLADATAKKSERRAARAAEQTQARAEGMAAIKVGDLFCRSWGYSMTFNDFYIVTEVKSKSLVVAKLGNKTVSGDGWTGQEMVDLSIRSEEGIKALASGKNSIIVKGDHASRTTAEERHYYNTMD